MNRIVEAHGSSSPNNNKIVFRSTDHANEKLWFFLEMIHRLVRDLSCEPNIYVSWSTSETRMRFVPSNMFSPPEILLLTASFADFFCYLRFVFGFVIRSCLFPYSLVVTCLERADLLALLCVLFSQCVFVTFPYGVLGLVWYLIVSIPKVDHHRFR